jgi:hypothetical protein
MQGCCALKIIRLGYWCVGMQKCGFEAKSLVNSCDFGWIFGKRPYEKGVVAKVRSIAVFISAIVMKTDSKILQQQ